MYNIYNLKHPPERAETPTQSGHETYVFQNPTTSRGAPMREDVPLSFNL